MQTKKVYCFDFDDNILHMSTKIKIMVLKHPQSGCATHYLLRHNKLLLIL